MTEFGVFKHKCVVFALELLTLEVEYCHLVYLCMYICVYEVCGCLCGKNLVVFLQNDVVLPLRASDALGRVQFPDVYMVYVYAWIVDVRCQVICMYVCVYYRVYNCAP